MCLHRLAKLCAESDIGYKLVRPTDDPNIFLPEWPYMGVGGGQECKYSKDDKKVRTIYKIGRTYRVRYKRFTTTISTCERYQIGVHLYLTPVFRRGMKTVMFRFKKAVAYGISGDEPTVVALEVTPLVVFSYLCV